MGVASKTAIGERKSSQDSLTQSSNSHYPRASPRYKQDRPGMTGSRIEEPITLKCGLTLPNRLVKTAMAESIAPSSMLPNEKFHTVYRHWAKGGWGTVLTGSVQVNAMHLGTHADLAVDESLSDDQIVEAWRAWADVCNERGTPTLMQINHPGQQSPTAAGKRGLFAKTIAPSAVSLNMGSGFLAKAVSALAFGRPREMTVPEIEAVTGQFARAARLAAKSGFVEVEIHAAHGYLLGRFLSAESNRRKDEFGGTPEKRAKIVVDTIRAVRAATPAGFCVGINLNSANDQAIADIEDRIEQLKLVTSAGIDFIELSGGTSEDPTMFVGPDRLGDPSNLEQEEASEAFFYTFAKAIKPHFRDIPFLLTGGFRSCRGMDSAVAGGVCELVGLARPAVLDPLLPKTTVLNPENKERNAVLRTESVKVPWIIKQIGVRALEVHMDNAWYVKRLKEMSKT